MERLDPIPSPPGHLLREFLHRFVPVLVFAAAIAGVGLLWNHRFVGTMLPGEVEPIRADVPLGHAGVITEILVDRFQPVTNGQPLAILETIDAGSASSELDILRTDLEVMRSRMSLDEERNDQNIEDLRIRWLEARVSLATVKVSLENSRRDLGRVDRLFRDKVIPEAEFDAVRTVNDALEAEVRERNVLVAGLEKTLVRLESEGKRDRGDSLEVLNRSLRAHEKRLEETRLVTIRSPLDGIVKSISFRRGQHVDTGAVFASVTAHRSELIVGYVRQPLTLRPEPGMPVEIRTRGPRRQFATSTVRSVGSDLDQVNSPLRLRGVDNSVVERGLAFFVDLPPALDVHPGELVDLVVRPSEPTRN